MSTGRIRLETDDPAATRTIDRPDRLCAFRSVRENGEVGTHLERRPPRSARWRESP